MTRNTFKAVKEWGVPREEMLPEPGPEMTWEEYINIHNISQNLATTLQHFTILYNSFLNKR
jgi:hypothetical protein